MAKKKYDGDWFMYVCYGIIIMFIIAGIATINGV